MSLRMLTAPITRSVINRRRWCLAPEWLIIAYVNPYTPGRTFAFRPDWNGGVITMKPLSGKDVVLNQFEDAMRADVPSPT